MVPRPRRGLSRQGSHSPSPRAPLLRLLRGLRVFIQDSCVESERVCTRPSRSLKSPEEGGGSLTSVHVLALTPQGQGAFQVWEPGAAEPSGLGRGGWGAGWEPLAFSSRTFIANPAQDYRGTPAPWCLSFLMLQGVGGMPLKERRRTEGVHTS